MRVVCLSFAAFVALLQTAPPQQPPTRPPAIPGASQGRGMPRPPAPGGARPQLQRIRSATGDALDRYLTGEYQRAVEVLLTVGGFEVTHAESWILAALSPAELERRRLAAALVALEYTAARPGLSPGLFEWGAKVLRERPSSAPVDLKRPPVVEPHAAEALWLRASVALAEGRKAWSLIESHLRYARTRAPADPHLHLAEAVAIEFATSQISQMLFSVSSVQASQTDRIEADQVGGVPSRAAHAEQLAAAAAVLEALDDDPRVAGEAQLRLGYIRLRLGRRAEALQHLDRVEAATREDFARFLAHLFAGWAHGRDGRSDDAVARYRAALAIVPRARSAATLLTAELTRAGRLSDAETVVDEFLARPPESGDPWQWYLLADYRHYPRLIEEMRGLLPKTGN